MIALFDALAILLLLGLGVAASPPGALAPVVWLAFTTPLLVRSDLAVRRLPNAVTMAVLAVVVITAGLGLGVETGVQDPGPALVAVAAVLVGGWAAFRTGALGLGDVKLAAGLVGSLLLAAPSGLVVFAAVTAVSGAAAAALWGHRAGAPPGVPYGPCLLLDYWSAFVASLW